MSENNNNNGKKRNDIFTKINDIISTFLDGYPPAVQTTAKVIVFWRYVPARHWYSPSHFAYYRNGCWQPSESHLHLRHPGTYRHLYRVQSQTHHDPRRELLPAE